MVITLGQARIAVSEYVGKAGKCPESEDTRLFVIEAVQRLLQRGAHGSLKKWRFCLANSYFTAPPDLEVPLKIKVGGQVEKVWGKWFEFFDISSGDLASDDYSPGLFEEVDPYYTIYDPPQIGVRIAAIPLAEEASDAYITVQGKDAFGREIYTTSNGIKIRGEKLKISRTNPVFSRSVFCGPITGIEKSVTNNYVRLYWQRMEGDETLSRGLLGEYAPAETNPSYRRFRVPVAQGALVSVLVLGKIRVMDYRHDNEILPIQNIGALRKMAQVMQAEEKKELQVAQYSDGVVDRMLLDENGYRSMGEEPFDFVLATSPGSIENLQ